MFWGRARKTRSPWEPADTREVVRREGLRKGAPRRRRELDSAPAEHVCCPAEQHTDTGEFEPGDELLPRSETAHIEATAHAGLAGVCCLKAATLIGC